MSSEPRKYSTPPKPEEQIRPDELARMMKKEKPTTGDKLKDIPATPENYKKFKGENERAGLPRGIVWGIAGLIVLFVAGSIISFYVIKEKVKQSISSQASALQAGVADLQNFNTQSAEQQFALLAGSSTPTFGGFVNAFSFLFKGGSAAVSSFGDLAKQLSTLSGEANSLETDLFSFTANGQGGNLVTGLTSIRDTLGAIDADSNQLSGALSSVGGVSALNGAGFYLPLKAQIEGAQTFLNAFIPWLAAPTPHHILVLFQNPSEMRPAGGFLGSYADVTLAGGNITDISVHDIADVDAGFTQKIIPPAPLQPEIKNFRPADANWFFDFPTSASETIQYFERSSLYATTTFDGAIAVSPQVISDLLSVTGPITLTSTKTTFTSSTLMVQIQNAVQQGQAQSATYPKAVIGQLSSAIFQQLSSSTDAQKQQLLSLALNWITDKDVMMYFNDPSFESFLTGYGAGGDVYQLPQNFNGDYLAIVDTNVNSDKSELYVTQNVSYDAQIDASGTITDTLTIDRTHNGNQSPYWWYQTTNQDYVQVFVPGSAALTDETGGVNKTIVPLMSAASYARNGYSTDPLVAAIASSTQSVFLYPAVTTHSEDGKEVFATWAVVAKGQTTELTFSYTDRAYIAPAPGVQYQFVFEKQAGTARNYDFEIDAPLGYVFAENGLATYEYTSSDPPGRLIITLTLEPIPAGQ